MWATWSQPVAEAVVFSNDFVSRRERPRRPWATSTRQACWMGRNTGCLSSQPTRRTSRSAKLRPNPRPRPERRRKVAPLAAGLGDVQPRVHDSPKVCCVLAAPLARRVEHRLQQGPLVIGQVTWVRHAPHRDDGSPHGNRDTPSQGVLDVERRNSFRSTTNVRIAAPPAATIPQVSALSPMAAEETPRSDRRSRGHPLRTCTRSATRRPGR